MVKNGIFSVGRKGGGSQTRFRCQYRSNVAATTTAAAAAAADRANQDYSHAHGHSPVH